MRHSRVQMSTWLLGVFVMLSCGSASGSLKPTADSPRMGVSEAYSHHDSSTTLYSSDNYLKCNSGEQLTVSSTEEISDLIKLYISRAEPVKIRATRRGFHSSLAFVCSGKRGSSHPEYHESAALPDQTTAITVLLHLMNRVVSVDRDRHQLTVEAGMTIRELALAAEASAMSVPAGALSIYANLTVGGSILASAHGSGYKTTSSLSDLVRKVRWVNAKGEILLSDVQTERGAKEVRALVEGLGLLGIVSEITFQLQANSRTVVEVRKDLKDAEIVAELKRMLEEETPHVTAFWRPDFGRYKAVLWKQVEEGEFNPATMPEFYPNGTIALINPFDEEIATAFKEVMAAWEDDPKDESPSADVVNSDICNMGRAGLDASVFLDGHGNLLDHATIPTNYAMVSADCIPKCSFDVHYMGTFTDDTEFTIKLTLFEDWVKDVKTIVQTELAEADARLRKRFGEGKARQCLPPGIFVLRFGQGNQNLLSTSTGSEDVVHLQLTFMHSAMVPNKLSKMSTILETIEQLTLCKYKGRPHWGKNHERTIRHPECKVRENFPARNIEKLLEIQQKHDPLKVFEPELFGQLLQKSGPEYSPLCTPHYLCYCQADSHCPQGFQCRGSASFGEYKICRLPEPSHVEL